MHKLLFIFMEFMTYSIIGWMIELVAVTIEKKKICKNRGFLIGPYCPIYGCCSMLIIFLLRQYEDDPWVLFIMSVVLCTTVEYLTSYIMEKLFKVRWWDYSHMKFNLNGRVCLSNSVLFGALGVFLLYILHPFVVNRYAEVPKMMFDITAMIVLVIFIVDAVISLEVIFKIKMTVDNMKKDHTEEITKKVKEMLIKQSFLTRRLINAFPGIKIFSSIKNKIIPKRGTKPKQKKD